MLLIENQAFIENEQIELHDNGRTSTKASSKGRAESELTPKDMEQNAQTDPGQIEETTIAVAEPKAVKAPKPKVKLGDFKFISLLGTGTSGKVFLMKHKDTAELFAMKILRKDKLIEQNMVDMAINEKKILNTLSHPFVIELSYSLQTFEKLYIFMPFVQGGELDTHLTQKKRMTESQAKIISFQLALVLSYLHENKLMYRDLKTENVMIDKDGYIQLIDFGLASKLNENEKSTVLCGTPDYMAPEIINQ